MGNKGDEDNGNVGTVGSTVENGTGGSLKTRKGIGGVSVFVDYGKSDKTAQNLKVGIEEYNNRLVGNSEFKNLEEEDKEVFKVISGDIEAIERANGAYYVYMNVPLFLKIQYGAKLRMGDRSICAYAGILFSKFQKLCKKYTLLRERINLWREELVARATENVAKSVIEGKDIDNSKWVLERLNKEEYGKNVVVSHSGTVDHKHTLNMEQLKELRESFGRAIEDVRRKEEEVVEGEVVEETPLRIETEE